MKTINKHIDNILKGMQVAYAAQKIVEFLEQEGFVSETCNRDITPEIIVLLPLKVK